MINANIKNFRELLANDAAAAADLDKVLVEATTKFAGAKGFSFSATELMDASKELSADQLDEVAGGRNVCIFAGGGRGEMTCIFSGQGR